MPAKLLTPPATEPIDLDLAKAHLRVDYPDDDSYIKALITAAREYCETVMGRSVMTQTWQLNRDSFPALSPNVPYAVAAPSGTLYGVWNQQGSSPLGWQTDLSSFRLPWPPLQSVSSITWLDTAGNLSTVPSSTYIVDTMSEPGRVALAYGQTWPSTSAQGNAISPVAGVTVTYVTGYPSAAQVPASIKHAILLLLAAWYENREDIVIDRRISAVSLPLGVQALLWRNAVPEPV